MKINKKWGTGLEQKFFELEKTICIKISNINAKGPDPVIIKSK